MSDAIKFDRREHVRKRPGMYLGGTDAKALHQLLWAIMDDAAEEITSGRGDHIWITLRPNHEICVQDNGGGIPIFRTESSGRSFLEHYMTLNDGHNGRRKNGGYGLAKGMFELGISYVSALCTECQIEVKREGFLWRQNYDKGIPTSDVVQIRPLDQGEATCTSITFTPDYSIFEPNQFDYGIVSEWSHDIAYCLPNTTLTLTDERCTPAQKAVIQHPGGMIELVTTLNANEQTLHDVIHHKGIWTIADTQGKREIEVEFALQYNDSMETTFRSHVNRLRVDGGTHIKGMRAGVTDVINEVALKNNNTTFSWEEIRAGLTVAIHIKHPDPSLESQFKLDLINPEVYGAAAGTVYSGMNAANNIIYPQTVSNTFEAIIAKCEANRKALGEG